MAEQKPIAVPADGAETSLVGKHQDDIIEGSRLERVITAQGGDPSDGKTDDAREPVISESRFARIMQGKRFMKRVEWPDMGVDDNGDPVVVEVGIVVLTEEEIEEAAVWASQRLKGSREVLDGIEYHERLSREGAIQMLWRATVDVETRRPFALSPDELRRLCPARILDWLWAEYVEHQEDLSPMTRPVLTQDELDAIVEDLKKAPEDIDLDPYDLGTLQTLLRRFAMSLTTP